MRYVQDLIEAVRKISNTENYTESGGVTTAGLSDNEILQYLNDAQDRIQSIISTGNPQSRPFTVAREVSIVGGQQAYSVPDRVFYGKEVEQVEYSFDGDSQNYSVLRKLDLFNNNTQRLDYPAGYYRAFNQIHLVPVPQSSRGKLRIQYERSCDDLDKRRGVITAVTVSSGQVTALTINISSDDATAIAAQRDKFLCICDGNGAVKAYNVPFTSYDSATGVFTLSSYTPNSTSETAAIGDYITLGKYTTTHSQLPDECETYLIHRAALVILRRTSSTEVANQEVLVSEMEDQIKRQMRTQGAELTYIPQVDFNEWW